MTGDEVDHGDVVAGGAVAAGAAFGGLDEAVESFEQAIADLGVPPAGDAEPVAFGIELNLSEYGSPERDGHAAAKPS